MEIEEKENWEIEFDRTFIEQSGLMLARHGQAIDYLKDFIRQTLTSDRLSLVEVIEGMKKPHFVTCEFSGREGYQAVCDCGTLDFNSALTDIISRLKEK